MSAFSLIHPLQLTHMQICLHQAIQDNAHPPHLHRPRCYLYKYEGQKLKLQAQRACSKPDGYRAPFFTL